MMPVVSWRKSICVLMAICCVIVTGSSFVVAQATGVQTTSTPPDEIQTRLRISWGGGTAKHFSGSIRLSNAEIRESSILGFKVDSPSTIRVEKNRIHVRPTSTPSSFEGIDATVIGSPSSMVSIEFFESGVERHIVKEFSLSEILNQDQVISLDQDNNRLSIVRAAGDTVQFHVDRPHLIFDSGEEFQFEFGICDSAGTEFSGNCLIDVVAARSNSDPVYTQNVKFAPNSNHPKMQQHAFTVPHEEGVYNLRFQVDSNRGKSLYRRRSCDREIQFVVLNPNRRLAVPRSYQKLVQEIGAETLRSSLTQQQLGQFSRLIGLKTNQTVGRYTIANDDKTVELPVGGWQAVPLNIKETGQPHVIELDYATDEPASLGLSILQPDASGQIPNFGFDSGLHIPDSIVKPSAVNRLGTHRFSFWPSSRKIYLLIANRHSTREAVYRGIRVYQSDGAELNDAPAAVDLDHRCSMSFFEQPMFVENFSVNNVVDPVLQQPIHDWVSFYESVLRLAQYLVDSGSGGAFINVMGEGSALMPLQKTPSSPRYDNGVFSSMGHDPIRKDVVELIYRVFEREGLRFVPVLTFDQRTTDFEFDEQLRADTRVIDFRGAVVEQDDYPLYNPLNQDVQQHVVKTIEKVAARYRNKTSFCGLAVVCRPDTYTLLPGSRVGGYDQKTIHRFDPEVSLPSDLLSNDRRELWIAWRREQMSQWYRQMYSAVRQQSEKAKLYLAFIDIFKNEELHSLLSPSLHRSTDLQQAFENLGLDLSELTQNEDLVIMQPEVSAPVHPLASRKSDIAARSSQQWDLWHRGSRYPASLFLHRSSWARFENLETSAVFSKQKMPILRLQHLNPAGVWNRERFAKSLLMSDARQLADGGLLLNTNLDRELMDFKSTYSKLPDQEFQDVPHQEFTDGQHPVAVRQAGVAGSSFLYCVNGSPWSIELEIQADRVGPQDWFFLSDASEFNFQSGQGGRWKLTLPPFGLFAVKAQDSSISFNSFVYELPEIANRELNQTYYELRARVIASGKAAPINVLEQPSFENGKFGSAWFIGGQSMQTFAFDSLNVYDGRYCLRIDNKQPQNLWIRSNRFQSPVTGRLSVSVWLKTSNPDAQPPLRISIESADTGSSYYRFAEVGRLASDSEKNQLTEQWRRFVVHFDDLPAVPLAGLRIGFDLMGAGDVSIDNVELYDRWMDEIDLKALTQTFAGVAPLITQPEKLESCRQILNGYWPQFLREYFDENNAVTSQELDVNQPVRSTMRRRFRRFVSPGIFQFR